MENKRQFTIWYYLGVVVLLFALQTYFARPHVGALAYSDFALARLLLTQEVVERPMLEELLARPASGAPALGPPVAVPAAAASAIDGSLRPPSRGR